MVRKDNEESVGLKKLLGLLKKIWISKRIFWEVEETVREIENNVELI
jgi:hypothetical protein